METKRERRPVRHTENLGEIVRFGVVGALATAIQYGIYWLLLGGLSATVANTLGYLVSFAFNFIMTTRFTFRVAPDRKKAAGFALSHVVNWMLQSVCLNVFLWLGVPKEWAPLPMFAVCVPVNFLLVRFFVKR